MEPQHTDAQVTPSRINRIIVSQAYTGEAVGIEHYARMVAIATRLDEQLGLLEDAWRERHHLMAMKVLADRMGCTPEDGRGDSYWSRVRVAFDECADRDDLLGCYVIQDIILECFALTLYERLAPHVDGAIRDSFIAIAKDERGHLQKGMERVRSAYEADPEGTFQRIEFGNDRVARVLAAWIRPEDCAPVCGVCGKVGGRCAKPELEALKVDMIRIRASFIGTYGSVLREVGLPPATVTRWLARLFV